MNAVRIILLIAFVLACLCIVLLVLLQDDGQNGMGGLLGGRGTAAFGSHSAGVLTRATFVFVVLFFALALSLALLNRRPRLQQNLMQEQTIESETTDGGSWWQSTETTEEAPQAETLPQEEAANNSGDANSEAAAGGAADASGAQN